MRAGGAGMAGTDNPSPDRRNPSASRLARQTGPDSRLGRTWAAGLALMALIPSSLASPPPPQGYSGGPIANWWELAISAAFLTLGAAMALILDGGRQGWLGAQATCPPQ